MIAQVRGVLQCRNDPAAADARHFVFEALDDRSLRSRHSQEQLGQMLRGDFHLLPPVRRCRRW